MKLLLLLGAGPRDLSLLGGDGGIGTGAFAALLAASCLCHSGIGGCRLGLGAVPIALGSMLDAFPGFATAAGVA